LNSIFHCSSHSPGPAARGQARIVAVGLLGLCAGCCPDVTRDWSVLGSVLEAETGVPVFGAEVSITILFTIDGPGNPTLETVTTAVDGAFVAKTEIVPSCVPVAFGFFGTEIENTSGTPESVFVRVTVEGTESATYFHPYQRPELVTEFETFPDGSVRGRIELPPIELEVPP